MPKIIPINKQDKADNQFSNVARNIENIICEMSVMNEHTKTLETRLARLEVKNSSNIKNDDIEIFGLMRTE
jgi:hypothetical protein